jgi:hypothetical protein
MYLYNQLGLFYSTYVTVNIQLNCLPAIFSSRVFQPLLRLIKLHVTPVCLAYAVIALTCVVLFFRISLFMILPLDSIIESKRKSKIDNEAKRRCKVVTIDEKIKILDKLVGGMSASDVGLTFCWYFILKSNFPLISYFNA